MKTKIFLFLLLITSNVYSQNLKFFMGEWERTQFVENKEINRGYGFSNSSYCILIEDSLIVTDYYNSVNDLIPYMSINHKLIYFDGNVLIFSRNHDNSIWKFDLTNINYGEIICGLKNENESDYHYKYSRVKILN